jgi:hypothetical protein
MLAAEQTRLTQAFDPLQIVKDIESVKRENDMLRLKI